MYSVKSFGGHPVEPRWDATDQKLLFMRFISQIPLPFLGLIWYYIQNLIFSGEPTWQIAPIDSKIIIIQNFILLLKKLPKNILEDAKFYNVLSFKKNQIPPNKAN